MLWMAWAAISTGCASRSAPAIAAPAAPTDAPYIDLEPGWRLRVVTPILKSGGYLLHTDDPEVSGNTIALSAADSVGFETAYYAVKARRGGGVRIVFSAAGVTKQGQTSPELQPLAPLFDFPRAARYVRLLYLVRSSR